MCAGRLSKKECGRGEVVFLGRCAHTTTRLPHCQQCPIWPISACQVIVALDDDRDLAKSREIVPNWKLRSRSGHGVPGGLCVSIIALQSNYVLDLLVDPISFFLTFLLNVCLISVTMISGHLLSPQIFLRTPSMCF